MPAAFQADAFQNDAFQVDGSPLVLRTVEASTLLMSEVNATATMSNLNVPMNLSETEVTVVD